jgi:hypothetical protein
MKYMHNQLNGADGGITQKIFFLSNYLQQHSTFNMASMHRRTPIHEFNDSILEDSSPT